MRNVGLSALLVAAAALAACSSGGPKPATSPSIRTETTAAPASAQDPLTGNWRQVFTCAEMVRLVSHGHTTNRDEWAASLPDLWGAPHQSPNGSLCAHAPRQFVRTARFANGHAVLFDPPNGEPGLNATYRITHAGLFTLDDGGNNIPGTYSFEFTVSGRTLAVRPLGAAARDAFFLAAWGSAPFQRARS